MPISPDLGECRSVSLSSGPLSYRERGEGRPLVFVHGLLVNGDLWRKVVPGLSDVAHCITPDWPLGSHDVARPADAEHTIETVAASVAEFLETLDLHDVVLVANDTGGAITQHLITTQPERVGGIVLTPCDAFENFLPPRFRPLEWLAKSQTLFDLTLQTLRFDAIRYSPLVLGGLVKRRLPPEIAESYVGPVLRDAGIRRDAGKLVRSIDPRITLEAAAKLEGFTKPTLLAWASEDQVFLPKHARALADRLPHAEVVWIDDSRSFVPEDRPEPLVEAMRSFLSRL
ncbi:MAG: alpha/beta hydrolase [Myxococcota bacterium]